MKRRTAMERLDEAVLRMAWQRVGRGPLVPSPKRMRAYRRALRALLRERAEKAERTLTEARNALLREGMERDGLAREVRAMRTMRDALPIPRDCIPFVHYDKTRAANEAQGWPSGGGK